MAVKTKLTERTLKNADAGVLHWDTEVPGLLARKAESGAVTLAFNYRVRSTGKMRRIKIGMLSDITVSMARAKAASMRLEVQ